MGGLKLRISHKNLMEAFKVVNTTIAEKDDGLYGNYMFRVNPEGKIEMMACQGRLFSSCTLKGAEFDADWRPRMIEGWRFKQWLLNISENTLHFEQEGAEINVWSDDQKQLIFQTTEDLNYPYFDELLAEAEVKKRVSAARLAEAIKFSTSFTGDAEGKRPDLCVSEIYDGAMFSMNDRTAALVTIPEFHGLHLRVHRDDAKAVIKFLGTVPPAEQPKDSMTEEEKAALPDGMVEIRTHERCFLLRREKDGAVLGNSIFHQAFPKIPLRRMDSALWVWKVDKEYLEKEIKAMSSAADKDDFRIRFNFKNGGECYMSMITPSRKWVEWPLKLAEPPTLAEEPAYPANGVTLNRQSLLLVLKAYPHNQVTFESFLKKKGGYTQFHYTEGEKGEDQYTIISSWLKNKA